MKKDKTTSNKYVWAFMFLLFFLMSASIFWFNYILTTSIPKFTLNYQDFLIKYYTNQSNWLNVALFGLAIVLAVIGVISALDYKSKKEEMDEIIREAKKVISSNESQMEKDLLEVKAYVNEAKANKYYLEGSKELNKRNDCKTIINYDKILEYFNKAIELKQDDPAFYNDRGVCLSEMGKYLEAIKDFKVAINLDSKDGLRYYNLVESYIMIEDFRAALNAIKKCSQEMPFPFVISNIDYNKWTNILDKNLGNEFVIEIKKIMDEKFVRET